MMGELVECVPNVSEGRDRAVIEALAAAVTATPGCNLLDVDPGASTNRTVLTFVGSPEAAVEGALAVARAAHERLDMRRHRGEHPRIGALDVCPFVPVAGVTLDECARLAEEFGRRAAAELGIPVYLYGAAARHPHRSSLAQIREGEYEGLAERIIRPEWAPDFGPAAFVPTWGATAAGARGFLIAYNVNLLGTREQAHRIALDLREQGRGPEHPGKLRAVKGIGWWVEEYGLAQVSMNLEDPDVTPLHVAYEACVEEARRLGVGVAGSEIVGLVPRTALLAAADHYVAAEGLFVLDERQRIRLAVDRLGLSSVTPFEPDRRVIEYAIGAGAPGPLSGLPLATFVDRVAARTPTPGGGSVAALVAALGAALGAMVGWLTYGKRRFETEDPVMRRILPPLHTATRALVPLVDEDAAAYDRYSEALRLPQAGPDEAAAREAALQEALRGAVEVPLRVMRLADGCWEAMLEMADHGNPASLTDLAVGARALETGMWGASRNVAVNLEGIADEGFRREAVAEAERLAARAVAQAAEVLARIGRR